MKCVKSVKVYDSGVPGVSPEAHIRIYNITVETNGLEYAQKVYPELANITQKL